MFRERSKVIVKTLDLMSRLHVIAWCPIHTHTHTHAALMLMQLGVLVWLTEMKLMIAMHSFTFGLLTSARLMSRV